MYVPESHRPIGWGSLKEPVIQDSGKADKRFSSTHSYAASLEKGLENPLVDMFNNGDRDSLAVAARDVVDIELYHTGWLLYGR